MNKVKRGKVKKRSPSGRAARSGSARAPQPVRKNMRAAEREKVILESAIRFFAEHGFGGQTRELAKRIGITHSAIYRHFPSKEALIERVYEHVYLGGWQKHWAGLILDRSRSLESRLTQFYCEYSDRIFSFDWVRIFVFSGLKSYDINARYLKMVMETIGKPALSEMRHELGLISPQLSPITPREQELFWGLHGRVFYIAVRKFVYGTAVPEGADRHVVIADGVRQFMLGARQMIDDILRASATEASASNILSRKPLR
jgi:AcrR family transcriptional regulator